jgi:hypothetical protein
MKVLGMTEAAPSVDVFSIALEPSDIIMIGNSGLSDEIATGGGVEPADAASVLTAVADRMLHAFPFMPATVGVIIVS